MKPITREYTDDVIYFDDTIAAQSKRVREHQLHTHAVPWLRLQGFAILLSIVWIHSVFVDHAQA